MKLDYYVSGKQSGTRAKTIGSVDELHAIIKLPEVAANVQKFRSGDAEAKRKLPAIDFMGYSTDGKRKSASMMPTGLIMIDIDHMEKDPRECWDIIMKRLLDHNDTVKNANPQEPIFIEKLKIKFAYVTPSGKGLRLVFANIHKPTIIENIQQIAQWLLLSDFGEVDECCKDLTRISFLVPTSEFLFIHQDAFNDEEVLIKVEATPPTDDKAEAPKKETTVVFSEDELKEAKEFRYNGFLVSDIVDKYLARRWDNEKHEPPVGKRHMEYNNLVRDFRNLVDNDPRLLCAILPTFGRPLEECFSQCKSICTRNTTSLLPKPFYFFLKDNGFTVGDAQQQQKAKELTDDSDPFRELNELIERMPKLPPVFREYVGAAPQYFKIPTVMSLLPIMGTLASYLEADYIDGETHTTSFITVVYAPASYGKSFINKFYPTLVRDLKNRDLVSAAKEQLYLQTVNRKGSNDKAPEDPLVTQRIMPAINSLPELLQKMRNNGGYHMLTICGEMDTWNKGSKSQGGDKSDLYRIAWDNGEYGQAFKSTGTFKGVVNLYYNVLLTGTPRSIKRYFKDIENGLVTRCSFCDLGDQAFAKFVPWKPLSKNDVAVIDRFLARCDSNSYTEPLMYDTAKIYNVKEEDFDKTVPWRFNMRERQSIDLSWIFPTLMQWLDNQATLAEESFDQARDTFRRRVAVRGFRLAMICYALWPNVGVREKQTIKDFVLWFMDVDIFNILKLFGKEYNDLMADNTQETYAWSTLFDALPQTFDINDLILECRKQDIKTPPRIIVHTWKRNKKLKKENGKYNKITK